MHAILRLTLSTMILALLFPATGMARDTSLQEAPEKQGLVAQSADYFAVPKTAINVTVTNGDLSTVTNNDPDGWNVRSCKTIEMLAPTDKEPHAKPFARLTPGAGEAFAISTDCQLAEGQTYFASIWLRSQISLSMRINCNANATISGRTVYRTIPSTEGTWKRVGFFFRAPAATTAGNISLHFTKQPIDIADLSLRTSPKDEYARAYAVWREKYRTYTRPVLDTDGANLALSVSKLQGQGIPSKPFLIWAVGSSYTNFLGDGETLIQEVQKRFPNAPPIVYKKHVGSATPWSYIHGWVRQFVIPEQPDLVLIYALGDNSDLEKMIIDLRRYTTADIIVPSLHLREAEANNVDQSVDTPSWNATREIAHKYKVEYVESRRELVDFMKQNGLGVKDLLVDAVHQNDLCALLINENIARHLVRTAKPATDPATRERQYTASEVFRKKIRGGTFTGAWSVDPQGILVARNAGARLTIPFTGNRIDLIGRTMPDGGTLRVRIDGLLAEEAPVFYTTFITPGVNNSGYAHTWGDKAPHCVMLGREPVPQTWTITLINNDGDYQLTGSVTGPDGQGNGTKLFTSNSGQIIIDPVMWRNFGGKDGIYSNRKDDRYTFDVYRCATGTCSFRRETQGVFSLPLAQNLSNGPHTLELIVEGNSPVFIDGWRVYEPAVK